MPGTVFTNRLSFDRVASPSTSIVGNRSAFVMRRPARASATRPAATVTSGLWASASSTSLSSVGSWKIVHHGSGSCAVASGCGGSAAGSGCSGFSGSTRETMQPLSTSGKRTATVSNRLNIGLTHFSAMLLVLLAAQAGDPAEEQRYEERRDERRRQHAADDAGTQRVTARGARARADGERQHAEDQAQRGHDDRPEAQLRTLDGRVRERHALVMLHHRELDDQDRVLRREAHQRQ